MSKVKKIPNQCTIRFKNNTDPRIIQFANMQDNFSDTVSYLIEKEIAENGLRNLQMFLPAVRNILEPIEHQNIENTKPVIQEKSKKSGQNIVLHEVKNKVEKKLVKQETNEDVIIEKNVIQPVEEDKTIKATVIQEKEPEENIKSLENESEKVEISDIHEENSASNEDGIPSEYEEEIPSEYED